MAFYEHITPAMNIMSLYLVSRQHNPATVVLLPCWSAVMAVEPCCCPAGRLWWQLNHLTALLVSCAGSTPLLFFCYCPVGLQCRANTSAGLQWLPPRVAGPESSRRPGKSKTSVNINSWKLIARRTRSSWCIVSRYFLVLINLVSESAQ